MRHPRMYMSKSGWLIRLTSVGNGSSVAFAFSPTARMLAAIIAPAVARTGSYVMFGVRISKDAFPMPGSWRHPLGVGGEQAPGGSGPIPAAPASGESSRFAASVRLYAGFGTLSLYQNVFAGLTNP